MNTIDEKLHWWEYMQAFTFLAEALNTPPNADMTKKLRELFLDPENPRYDLDGDGGYEAMVTYFEENADRAIDDLTQELAIDWTRLFRGVSREHGPQPPYEGIYRQNDGVGVEIIQNVNREYVKYGLSMEGHLDRPDYLGVELDFVSFLSKNAALAVENQQQKEEDKYRVDFVHFLTEHISNWVDKYCQEAGEHAHTPFYSGVLMMLKNTVTEVATACIAESK